MLGQNLQNVVGQIMDFYLAKTYKKVLPKTVLARQQDMYAYDFIGRRYDVGDKQGYLEAQVEYALRREDLAGKFREYLKTIVHK